MEYIEKIKKMLCKELEEIAESGKLKSPADISMIKDLTGAVKNIGVIEMQEEESGYSEARGGRGRGRSSYMGGSSYDDDMMYSERRGRGRYAKRDSMGRYSSEGGSYEGGSSYDDYSEARMDRRYSRDDAKDHLLNKMGEMMSSADEEQKEILKDAMRKIERA
ncbi:MAG: hypothetical protein IKY67_06005 [Paludibacteraceae bacterium]|nr:hypothetical protein [Paludibacteraceae bacterium]